MGGEEDEEVEDERDEVDGVEDERGTEEVDDDA